MVLAADPPDISIGATSAACSESARSASIRVIDPLTSSCAVMNSSVWCAITSTSALPIPTTWNLAGVPPPARPAPPRGITLPWAHAQRRLSRAAVHPPRPGREGSVVDRPAGALGGPLVVPEGGDARLNDRGTGLP